MPEFAADTAHPEVNLLSAQELDLLARWFREGDTDARTQGR